MPSANVRWLAQALSFDALSTPVGPLRTRSEPETYVYITEPQGGICTWDLFGLQ